MLALWSQQKAQWRQCSPSNSWVHAETCLSVCSAGGSFRHFLWQVCKELQSSSLSLLLLCPSSAVNKNKVRKPLCSGSLWSCPLSTHISGPGGTALMPS